MTDSVRLGVVYLNLLFITASGVMFCEIYLQLCGPHHHDPRFIYIFYFQVFLTYDYPRSSILDPDFPVNVEVLLIKIVLVFDHRSNQLFQSNRLFQAIEFVDPPVPEKLDMGFLFYGHEVRDSQVQSYPYKHIRDTYVTSDA